MQPRVPPKGDWRYEIPCSKPESAAKLVSRADMLAALSLKATTPLFTWKGLKTISEAEHRALRHLMGLP